MNRRWLAVLAAVPLALGAVGTGTVGTAVARAEQPTDFVAASRVADAPAPALSPDPSPDPSPRPSPSPAPAPDLDPAPDGVYVVQLAELPVAAYDGSTPGLASTRPARGAKIDITSAAVTRWVAHLRGAHASALRSVGAAAPIYDYAYGYNGFAARLTASQATRLRLTSGVLAVSKQLTYSVDTTTPTPLGPSDAGAVWDGPGGATSAGNGVVIGVIDSGVWPESLAFADRVDTTGRPTRTPSGRLAYQPVPGWRADCQTGEKWSASQCNLKLVTARYFNRGQGGDAAIARDRPWEFNSPRDYNGHGTHTASTSAGNGALPVTGPAAGLAPDGISGVAPRARIAVYKALWSARSGDTASGTTSDLVAAVDQSVADGVDVLNYSVSGTRTDIADPVEIAFLFAADAGIFVAASAGNSGPAAATVAHPSPWVTTVAAATHGRAGRGSMTLGTGVRLVGASVAANEVSAPLVNSTAAALPGADPARVARCSSSADGGAVLDPAKVAGRIVVCERGVTGRTNKSLAVGEAGGVGMVLVNTSPGSVDADLHAVPTIHLPDTDRLAVEAYAATAGATATIHRGEPTTSSTPATASFSSRGPLLAGGGDLLKPDLIAPGQDVLGPVSPTASSAAASASSASSGAGGGFTLLSGTSMASAHVAGLAAGLLDLHPDWSPMAVKSALMTTGYDVTHARGTWGPAAFAEGAGHVDPRAAADPGLVYDSGWDDWLAYLCGTAGAVPARTCAALAPAGRQHTSDQHSTGDQPSTGDQHSTVDQHSDLNGASIAVGDLSGARTVTRRVTNVGSASATYTAQVSGLDGFSTVVTPSTLTVDPGRSASFTVTVTRTTSSLTAYAGGWLTWSDGRHTVRSPVVVRPVAPTPARAPAPATAPATTSASATGTS